MVSYSCICFVMLCYALLCYVGKPLTKEPLLQVKGKGREANCLFLSYSTSRRRGKGFGGSGKCCYVVEWWGSLPKCWFLFCKYTCCMNSWVLVSCMKLLGLGSHSLVKRSNLWTKVFIFWNWFSSFCVWTQRGYGKAKKSLCFIMHLNLEIWPKCK